MTRDEYDENYCYFIDRKIMKGYKLPRVIYTKYNLNEPINI